LVAHVCHICADKPGGPRFDPEQTEKDRQDYENLIVFCPNHHTLIDNDEATYTVTVLKEMKRQHEKTAQKEFVISDDLAKQAATGVLAASIGVTELWRSTESKGEDVTKLIADLHRILKYAPKGLVICKFANEEIAIFLNFLTEIFRQSGWRIQFETDPLNKNIELRPSAILLFILPTRHQIPVGEQAVLEFLERCGFHPVKQNEVETLESDKFVLTIAFGALK